MTTHRKDRLADGIRDEVARILAREVKDPRLGFVTVTRVDLSGDGRWVRVHASVLGSEADQQRTMKGLEAAAGFVRRLIGQRLRLRYAPEIQFALDRGLEATARVAHLLDEIDEAPRSEAAPADGPPPDDEGEPPA